MPRELIKRARSILRGQDFEGEPRDRNFGNVTRIDYFIEGRSATIHTKDLGKEYVEEGVYRVVTGDGVSLESALAENFERTHAVITFDVHPNVGPVNAYFDEAKGEIELYLAE